MNRYDGLLNCSGLGATDIWPLTRLGWYALDDGQLCLTPPGVCAGRSIWSSPAYSATGTTWSTAVATSVQRGPLRTHRGKWPQLRLRVLRRDGYECQIMMTPLTWPAFVVHVMPARPRASQRGDGTIANKRKPYIHPGLV